MAVNEPCDPPTTHRYLSDPADGRYVVCRRCGFRRLAMYSKHRREVIRSAALDMATERDMAEAYYQTLERHLREHGCEHDFADIANGDVA